MLFPDCEHTQELVLKTKALISNSPDKELKALDTFHNEMCKNASESVPYAPAIRRLTGQDTTLYVVAAYKDGKFFSTELVPEMLQTLQMQQKYNSPVVTSADKSRLWSLIHTMITLSKLKHNLPVDHELPTGEQIATNIRTHKADEGDSSASQLLHTAIQLLIQALQSFIDKVPLNPEEDNKAKKSLEEILASTQTKQQADAFREEFTRHIDLPIAPDSYSFAVAAKRKEFANFAKCQAPVLLPCQLSERWQQHSQQSSEAPDVQFLLDAVTQCTSCFSVQKSLPTKLLNTIEQRARQIEASIQTGASASDVNVAQIGFDVMKDCDPQEMQELVGNMKDLIPQLGNLAGAIPQQEGMPDVQKLMRSLQPQMFEAE